jgi:hypothetical protein
MKNTWAYVLGIILILAGIVGGFLKPAPRQGAGFTALDERSAGPAVLPTNNIPVVIGFKGDLEDGGTKQNIDVPTLPFVIGDIVKLECEALNAIEYRWLADGVVQKDKDQEWSTRPDREWEVRESGPHRFAVQVRGTDPKIVSQLREKTLTTEKLFIESFAANAVEGDDDRALTGDEYTVEVSMADPLTADPEFYLFRYLINDEPIKHPETGEEWSNETSLTYAFPAPGKYTFKVEVRRATEKDTEASATMAQTMTVADAVLRSFDASPEKTAALGASIALDCFASSLIGKSECRFGVRRIDAADFEWLAQEDGALWGESEREWRPTEPNTYVIRAEIREVGKTQYDDYREMTYTITEAGF